MRGNDRSIVDRPRHRKLQLVTDHDRTPSGALLPVPGQQHRRTLYQYRSIHPRLSTRQARCAPDSDAARAGLPKFEKISAGCGYTEPPRASLGRRSSASIILCSSWCVVCVMFRSFVDSAHRHKRWCNCIRHTMVFMK